MIKELINLFKAFCKTTGCPDWLANEILFYLTLIGFVLFVLKQIINFTKKCILWRNQRILNQDLAPYYSQSDVYRATRYYISTRYQNVAPSADVELGSKYIAAAKEKLIPLFLNKAFKNDEDDNKFYMIFADSGMGKTTFLVNLYINYKNRWKNPLNAHQFEIKLFPLGYPNVLEDIEKVKDKQNTIILLDALDEDIEAVKDYKKRLNLILSKVHKFREIVITCRTQFFPSEAEEPDRTGYFSAGERGEYRFQKLYLSVFDDKNIKQYLKKRFSILQYKKYKQAKKIAEKSPNLVVRPMLLSYIEELVDSNKEFEFSFQIYEALIENWITRESRKPKISSRYGNEENFKNLLYQFSQELAINLYENRKRRNGYFIPKGEYFGNEQLDLEQIEKERIELSESEKRSKSLLNRNAVGEYKFSHKSVFEYFLAKELTVNDQFYIDFDFTGMDAAKRFVNEIQIDILRKSDGEYRLNGQKKQSH